MSKSGYEIGHQTVTKAIQQFGKKWYEFLDERIINLKTEKSKITILMTKIKPKKVLFQEDKVLIVLTMFGGQPISVIKIQLIFFSNYFVEIMKIFMQPFSILIFGKQFMAGLPHAT